MSDPEKIEKVPEPILVVDDDQMMVELVSELFRNLGYSEIKTATDGEEAWKIVKERECRFVVIDWKLPKIPGYIIFNRIRQDEELSRMPMLVMSGMLTKADFALLEEYPFTHFLQKPFTQVLLEEMLEEIISETGWHQSQEQNIIQFMELLNSNDHKKAFNGLQAVIAGAKRKVALTLIAARLFRKKGFFAEAETLLAQLLKASPNCMQAISELGKLYLSTKRFDEAGKLLQAAQAYSPKNIERLCMIGEAKLHESEVEEAKTCFEEALDLDPDALSAKQGMTVVENTKSFFDHTPESSNISYSFGSLMNSVGISLVRGGRIAEGIAQYEAALKFIHAKEVIARLSFNVGLAYLRWNKPDDARKWFEKSLAESEGKFQKAKNYLSSKKMDSSASVSDLETDLGEAENL